MEEENNFKEKIEKLLKENSQGLTIQDISDMLNITRITVSIALAELKGEEKLDIREIGQAKLHILKQGENNGK